VAKSRKPSADVIDEEAALKIFQTQLKWSDPHPVCDLAREVLPDRPGIYVFLTAPVKINPTDALYVGKTDGVETSLRARVWGYCVTPMPLREAHRGRKLLFQYRKANSDRNLFVCWAVYSAAADIEGALIGLLTPRFNSRWETVWADEHEIDPRYVGDPYQCPPARRRVKK
jgi:hypothetical protein